MNKQLTTQDVTITTATVEVRTLTIGRKQVTLAVFRQLPESRLVAEDGTLNGEPWGWVNYCPDKTCGDPTDHRHFVWQRDGELRRSLVSGVLPDGRYWPEEADAFISAHIREVFEGRGRYFNGALPRIDQRDALFGESGLPVGAELSNDLAYAVNHWKVWREAVARAEQNPGDTHYAGCVERDRAALDKRLEKLGPAPSSEEVDAMRAALKARVAPEAQRRQRHVDVRAALSELPQLFIAV